MKTLAIQITEQDYTLICLRLIDPQAHLQNFTETMLHNAMQEHGYTQAPGGHYSEADIKEALAKPSAAQREAERVAQQKADNEAAMSAKQIKAAATNSPDGDTESVITTDNYVRANAAFIAQLRDGKLEPTLNSARAAGRGG